MKQYKRKSDISRWCRNNGIDFRSVKPDTAQLRFKNTNGGITTLHLGFERVNITGRKFVWVYDLEMWTDTKIGILVAQGRCSKPLDMQDLQLKEAPVTLKDRIVNLIDAILQFFRKG